MRAIEISMPGGPEVLVPAERPMPQAGHGQIVIKVAYAGVNRPDTLQRAGLYDPPPGASELPGLEAAGEVAEVGPGVTRWKRGDLVTALLPGGGYADYAATHADHALKIPAEMGLDQAAALCETYFTVWSNVFMRGGLTAAERILIHGGASGIGTTAIQLARAFGARVFATAGSDEKCGVCVDLGAERTINYRKEDFEKAMRDIGGAHMILDMVGGDYTPRNIRALADDGRLVQIAFLRGAVVEKMNFAEMMTRRLTLTGSTLRPQSDLSKARIAESLRAHVWPLLASGRIGPVMHGEFPLEQAAEAHSLMESGAHIGKIVLKT
ncbi:MAG: NAD(P)H-quinone oxidoreductase [Pseudomonadota bacterium]